MSQQNAAKFKIVYGSAGTSAISSPVKRGRGRPPTRNADLEQAINSISDDSMKSPLKAAIVANTPQEKSEKIVFMPKYVQKNVRVIRDQNRPGSLNSPLMKKRKLGDIAMQNWIKKPPAELEEEAESPTLLCRVCGSLIKDGVVELVDDSGNLTDFGAKLKAIVGTDINDSPLYPPACCKPCSLKINVCFSLLIELQASDEVVRCTYADLQEGDLVNPSAHIYSCAECEKEVIGMKDFIAHYEEHMQSKTIDCPSKVKNEPVAEDDGIFARAQQYLEEEKDDGTVLFQNEAGELVCEVCGRSFKYRFLLQLHKKAPKRAAREADPPSKVCFVCKQSRVSTQPYDLSYLCTCENNLAVSYENCQEILIGPDDEEAQQILDEFLEENNRENGQQDGVDAGSISDDWTEHLGLKKYEPKKRNRYRNYECRYCLLAFDTKNKLENHLQLHEELISTFPDTKANWCPDCDVSFDDILSISSHLQEVHDVKWNPTGHYSCTVCKKSFPNLFKMRMHLALMHDTQILLSSRKRCDVFFSYKCELCGEVCRTKKNTINHLKNMHNFTIDDIPEEILKEECELCGAKFSQRVSLVNHINTHLGLKPLECDECGETFLKHSGLAVHKYRHTGEKNYCCQTCQKTFRQRNDAMRHLARHVAAGEVLMEAAYLTNNSNSKLVTKRLLYLKDSVHKDLAVANNKVQPPSSEPKKEKKKSRRKVESPVLIYVEQDEVEGEKTDSYVVNEEGHLVPLEKPDDRVEKYEILEGNMARSPNGSRYKITFGETGALELVKTTENEPLVQGVWCYNEKDSVP